MCREAAVPELAARIPGIALAQMWVCDLVMSRSLLIIGGELRVSGPISEIQTPNL